MQTLLRAITSSLSIFVGVAAIYECVRRPKLLAQRLPSGDASAVLREQREDLEGLGLKANFDAMFAQFAVPEVQMERTEANVFGTLRGLHGGDAVYPIITAARTSR